MKDPLMTGNNPKVRCLIETLKTGRNVYQRATELNIPLLVRPLLFFRCVHETLSHFSLNLRLCTPRCTATKP